MKSYFFPRRIANFKTGFHIARTQRILLSKIQNSNRIRTQLQKLVTFTRADFRFRSHWKWLMKIRHSFAASHERYFPPTLELMGGFYWRFLLAIGGVGAFFFIACAEKVSSPGERIRNATNRKVLEMFDPFLVILICRFFVLVRLHFVPEHLCSYYLMISIFWLQFPINENLHSIIHIAVYKKQKVKAFLSLSLLLLYIEPISISSFQKGKSY